MVRALLVLVQIACFSVVLASTAALACGQVGPCEVSQPGGKTTVRGYGYGFEGGDRPVTLVWKADGTVAGRAKINSDGEFLVEITVPPTPGTHQLMIRNGDADPSPVNVTIPVMVPPPHQRLMAWTTSILPGSAISWTVGLLGLLLAAVLGGVALDGRRPYNTKVPA